MSPTFLLVALLIVVAMLAPVVLLVTTAMTVWPSTRGAGKRALAGGLIGSVALIVVDLAVNLAIEGTVAAATADGLLFSSALGFNTGVCWRAAASLRTRSQSPAPGR